MKKWLARKLRELLSVRSSEKRSLHRVKFSLEENEEKVSNVLTLLGAQYNRVELEDGRILYNFDFQGGRFRFFVSDERYVKILFPYFYSVDPENLNLLRFSCNECNLMSIVSKVVYTFNEKGNQYGVHIQSSFSMENSDESFDLRISDILKGIFEFSRKFRDVFESQMEKFRQVDTEEAISAKERNIFLLREQEIQHIMPTYRWRVNGSEKMTIGQFFDKLFDLPTDSFSYMTLSRPPHASENKEGQSCFSLTDADEIANYDVLSAIVEGEGKEAHFSYDWVEITLWVNHSMAAGGPQLYTIMMQPTGEIKGSLYVRLTVCQAPVSNSKNVLEENDTPNPLSYSFVIAYDRTDPSERLQEFKFMMQDAMDKVEEHRESELTEEQNMMLTNMDNDISYALYFGTRYYSSGRYFEALILLEKAYWASQEKFEDGDDHFCDRFFQLCYYIGCCHAELKHYQKALYYLQILYPVKSIHYTMAYINSLVNSGDFRAARVVDDLIEGVNNTLKEDDSESGPSQDVLDFLDFLRRRKVYLQVERNELDEAEEECKKMLEEPNNNSFALTELAYIQSIRREDEEEAMMEGE